MSVVTISQLASDVGVPVDRLIKQLNEAGITKSAETDEVTAEEKKQLLDHLRSGHAPAVEAKPASGRKITLKRKTTSELSQGAKSTGRTSARGTVAKSKTVKVEVKRKRTFVKSDAKGDDAEKLQLEAEEAKKALEDQARQREEMEAQNEARIQAEKERLKAEVEEREAAEAAKKKAEEDAEKQALKEQREAAAKQARAEQEAKSQKKSDLGKSRKGKKSSRPGDADDSRYREE
ncbi:MAG: translation initiation factor IF-2, partial [Gammaproteobacteria bacterium]|nr:translation initiation factor IF-2 [Gammaproteobacteria bacterium]